MSPKGDGHALTDRHDSRNSNWTSNTPDVEVCAATQVLQLEEPVRLLLLHSVENLRLPQHCSGCVHLPKLHHFKDNLEHMCMCMSSYLLDITADMTAAHWSLTCSYRFSSLPCGSLRRETMGRTWSQRPLLTSETKFSMLSTVFKDTWHSFCRQTSSQES